MDITLTKEERRFFRDQLRDAREVALLDAEGFHPIVTALERLGAVLQRDGNNLGDFQEPLLSIARQAKSTPLGDADRGLFTPVEVLYASVKNGRNDAVHQGAYARHLVRHCVELAILIEEGLVADLKCVADFMVRSPACAETWQPVALARQRMLTSSYSYLPIRVDGEWKLISDYAIASYLSTAGRPRDALRERIAVVYERGALSLETAALVGPHASIQQALEISGGRPVLVVEDQRLLGLATPFDFL